MTKKQLLYKISICLGINLVIVCLAIFLFGTHLYMDDDNILSWLAYGIITEPSSRTLYTHVILGWLYKQLFLIMPGFNWQTLIYYLFLLFSGTIGLYTVIKKNNERLIILWFFFEVVFYHDVYINLTFSVVAGFIACQGFLALFLTVEDKVKEKWLYIASGIIISISSMIRTGPFFSTSGFAAVIWIILVAENYKNKKNIKFVLKYYVFPFAVIIGVCFALILFDKACYSKGDWKEYADHENASSIVTDEYNGANCAGFELLEEVGVSKAQGEAVVGWRSNDTEILTTELIERIVSTKNHYSYITSPYVWRTFWNQWKVIFSRDLEIYFSLVLLISLSVILKKITPFILLTPFLGEVFYLAYIGRMDDDSYPERCIYVILMPLAMSSIILFEVFRQTNENNRFLSLALLVLICISAIAPQSRKDFGIHGLGLVDVDELCKEYGYFGNNDKVYVCEYYVRTEVEDAFGAWQTPSAGFMDHTIVIGSWTIDHPMQNALQKSLGCENPYRALFENENVYYIRLNSTEADILRYLQENYDERIDIEYIKEKGNFNVYKYYIE